MFSHSGIYMLYIVGHCTNSRNSIQSYNLPIPYSFWCLTHTQYGDYGNGRITYIDIGLLMMDLNEEHFVTSYEVQDMIKAMGLVVDNTFDFKEFLEVRTTYI